MLCPRFHSLPISSILSLFLKTAASLSPVFRRIDGDSSFPSTFWCDLASLQYVAICDGDASIFIPTSGFFGALESDLLLLGR